MFRLYMGARRQVQGGARAPPGFWLKIFCNVVLLQHINSLTDIIKEHRDHAEKH